MTLRTTAPIWRMEGHRVPKRTYLRQTIADRLSAVSKRSGMTDAAIISVAVEHYLETIHPQTDARS